MPRMFSKKTNRGGGLPGPSRPGDPASAERQDRRDAELAGLVVGTYYLIQPTSVEPGEPGDPDEPGALESYTGMLTGSDVKTATFSYLKDKNNNSVPDRSFNRDEYGFTNPNSASKAGRRRRTRRRTIRMKKGEYLREHHHLFRVLQNPTRRALNAELRAQKRELKERGLKG